MVEPKSVIVNGTSVPVEGLFTSIMEPVCDTTKGDGSKVSVEDHIANVQNELRKLGATEEMVEDVMECMAWANEAKPFIRFGTRKREAREYLDKATKKMVKGEEGVWEDWYGSKGLEDYVPPGAGDEVVDRNAPSANGAAGHAAAGDDGTRDDAGQAPDEGLSPDLSLEQLAEIADGDAGAEADQAQDVLTAKALEMGMEQTDVDGAENWVAVVAMIEAAGAEPDPEPEPEPEPPWEPTKGTVCKLQQLGKDGKPAINPKTKKKLPPLEVEVVTADKKKKLATVKDTTTKKPVLGSDGKPKAIAFDLLEPAD